MAGGYLFDQVFGDGEYTAREAVVDAAGGAIGGSLAKPLIRGGAQTVKFAGQSIRHRAIYSSTTAHAKDVALAGSTLMARNILTKPVLRGQVKGSVVAHSAGYVYDYFRESPGSSALSYQQHGGPGGKKSYRPAHSNADIAKMSKSRRSRVCRSGYELRKVSRSGWMCVRKNIRKR